MELSAWKPACRVPGISFIVIILLLPVFFAGCSNTVQSADTLPFYNTADFTAEWIDQSDPGYTTIHRIDTFAMHDQTGQLYGSDSLRGKIYVANFFFTICPTICPRMMDNLKNLQDSFFDDDRFRMVSFSVMPESDSIARLRQYGEKLNINPYKWHLLTGNVERTYELGRESFFAEKRLGLYKDVSEFLHTESMLLIDRSGRIRGIYNATKKEDVARITEDIKILLRE